jgi:hypothetical protein
MQHLCGVYAQWFNWKYGRRGHLFGRRFGSVHIVSDEHLFEAHRYVALNPVRAGLCARPELWRWGSLRSLVGLEDPPPFLDVAGTLGLFAPRQALAQTALSRFVNAVDLDHEDLPCRIPGLIRLARHVPGVTAEQPGCDPDSGRDGKRLGSDPGCSRRGTKAV